LSDWLYQYWFFCFKTAKHWGKGPDIWTTELLDFDRYRSKAVSSLPGTPQDLAYSSTPHVNDELTPPSDLCRWYIHVRQENRQSTPEDSFEPLYFARYDRTNHRTSIPWSPNEQQASLQAHLRNALEHNDFSSTPATDLPVAISEIAKAADEERSNELLIESLGFSIMSRNLDQIDEVLKELRQKDIDPSSLRPFHLATSFLDGSESCCNVIATLARNYFVPDFRKMYLNEHGHTIVDNLMIAIIKSHTSAMPAIVDNNLRDVARFIGEEVDICGRWDADSPCVRQLHAHGRTSIPSSWKHKFCNTSIQTICHCINVIIGRMPNRMILETPSGLYIRRCLSTDCGKELKLQPLHSLVMTAYNLAIQGRDGEDLFGMLACALCIISHGFDPAVRAEISVAALLSLDSGGECDHKEYTAAGLAQEILSVPAFRTWNAKLKIGWTVLTGVLHRCEAAHIEQVDRGDNNLDPRREVHYAGSTGPNDMLRVAHRYPRSHSLCFTGQNHLGTLWSAVQAELLSYRRLSDGLGWMSQYFSMETLQDQLEKDEDLMVRYAEHNLLKAHCACHSFGRYPLALLSDAIDPDLANLNVRERATYGI
jgi:hypothetical protein